jgi:alpha-aminoadipic semialdehyde synthase
MNCIYWTNKYPRLVTVDFIKRHWSSKTRKLRIIGDVSCDVKGAIEFTVQCTDAGNPGFTYLVDEERGLQGVTGNGPVIMAVDNLPCEIPRESSTSFSETLLTFIPHLAKADFTVPFEELELLPELKNAVVVYQGHLTENYKYLEKHVPT